MFSGVDTGIADYSNGGRFQKQYRWGIVLVNVCGILLMKPLLSLK